MADGRHSSEAEQAVASELLESGAVNFDAIGSALAKHGPQLAREGLIGSVAGELEPWEVFCGTMRWYVRVYRLPPVFGPLEELSKLREVSGELHH